jgi:RNA polymerase sigma-70 factor, ECF subfamily
MTHRSLAATFAAEIDDASIGDDPELEAALQRFVEAARAEIDVEPHAFVRHLAPRLPRQDTAGQIDDFRAEDLALAFACTRGGAAAQTLFVARFGEVLEQTLRRIGLADLADDVRQSLLEQLLLPRGDRPPALASYSGRGPLSAYLRVAITRMAIRLAKRRRKDAPASDALIDRAVADADPELAALRSTYQGAVKASFQRALTALPRRQQRLLRYHYVEDLTLRQMGAMLSVNASTVMRRLAQARAELLKAARADLMTALDARESEVLSIVRLVESQLDLSLERILATRPAVEPGRD